MRTKAVFFSCGGRSVTSGRATDVDKCGQDPFNTGGDCTARVGQRSGEYDSGEWADGEGEGYKLRWGMG